MKFRSRKDILFVIVMYGICAMMGWIFFKEVTTNKIDSTTYGIAAVLGSIVLLIIWLMEGTKYTLNKEELTYKITLFKGKIPLENINEIVVGKTMWMGLRIATARKGLIVKYGKYDEIYISPESNEAFVKTLLELKPDVKISR